MYRGGGVMWENPPLWISSCRRTRMKKNNQNQTKKKIKTKPKKNQKKKTKHNQPK